MPYDPYNLDEENNPLVPDEEGDQKTPTGLPQLAQRQSEGGLRDLGSSGTLIGEPASAKGISVIRGTADSGIVPDKINNLQDLANTIQGMGLNRRPSWQVQHNSPELAKEIEANKIANLNALSHYATAQTQASGLVEAAKARAAGGTKLQDTLLSNMMKKQELEKSQGEALGQFQQSLVGSGAATMDAKTGKASFTDPRYEKLFGDYAAAIKGVADPTAIKGINEQFQQRLTSTSDWINNSSDKVLKNLAADLTTYGKDLLPQGADLAQAMVNIQTHLQRDPSNSPEARAALSIIKEVQRRKERDTIQREQASKLQTARGAIGGSKIPPVWAAFEPNPANWPDQ